MTLSRKKIVDLVDELYTTQQERYVIQRKAKTMEDREKEIRATLIAELPKFGATGLAGQVALAKLETKYIGKVDDVAKFHKYIVKNDAWDLLQQRISDPAVRARWDAGKKIDGVVQDTVTFVSLHKIDAK